MTPTQKLALEAAEALGSTINYSPTELPYELRETIGDAIQHRLDDFMLADSATRSIESLARLIHVAYRGAVAFGVDMEPVMAEVHRATLALRWTKEQVDQFLLHDGRGDTPAGKLCPTIGSVVITRAGDGMFLLGAANQSEALPPPYYESAKLHPILTEQMLPQEPELHVGSYC